MNTDSLSSIPEKYCSKCKMTLPVTSFAKGKREKDGLQSWCKACRKSHYDLHREEVRAKSKLFRQEHSKELAERQQRYSQANREKIKEYQQRYRVSETGRLKSKVHKQERRMQKLTSGGSHTSKQLQEQLQRQRRKCYYCHVKLDKTYHVDHVVPLAKGGSNDISNIVIACPFCNMSKHDKLPHEWINGGRLL